MRTHHYRLFTLSLLALVVLMLGAVIVSAQDGGVFRVGVVEPVNLDPATGSNDPEVLLNRHIYNYLIEATPTGDLEPSLASSWTVSEDGLTYTFNLVQNATFHDGSTFTSADVIFTFNRLVEVGSSAVALLGQKITGQDAEGNNLFAPTFTVSAPDDFTVVFTLETPNADFLYGISSRFAGILPEGLATPNNIAEGGIASFNGTGAFRVSEYNPGVGAVLVANDNYWGGRPALDQIDLVFIDDLNAQLNALRSGDVDFIFKIPTDSLAQIEDDANITVTTVATNTHPVIRLRADAGHLGEDVRVRQAFKLATDRELLNLDFLNGLGRVGNNDPIGPVYGPLFNQQPDNYDSEMACSLLTEYATENPDNPWVTLDGDSARLEVDFYVVDALGYPVLGEFLQQQWEEGCIFVNLLPRPENIYYGNNEWIDVDLGLTGWGTRPTPQEYLSVAYVTGAPYNEAHWSNATLDAFAAQAATTADIQARAAIYNEISALFATEGPIIIPFFLPIHGAYRNTVEGLQMHPFPGSTNFYGVTVNG